MIELLAYTPVSPHREIDAAIGRIELAIMAKAILLALFLAVFARRK